MSHKAVCFLKSRCTKLLDGIPQHGLLLGQRIDSRDIVVAMIPTPSTSDEDTGGHLDSEWIGEHARQIYRMLCGGISILGFYDINTASNINTNKGMMQTIAVTIRNVLKDEAADPSYVQDDVLLVSGGTDTKKFAASLAKFTNGKLENLKSATFELVNESTMNPIRVYDTDWKLNISFIPNSESKTSLFAQLQTSLQNEFSKIRSSFLLFEENKKTRKTDLSVQHHDVNILSPIGTSSKVENYNEGSALITFNGTISSKTFVLSDKSNNESISNMIKQDIISTINSRLNLWSEELEALSAEEDNAVKQSSRTFLFKALMDEKGLPSDCAPQSWLIPNRIFIPFPSDLSITVNTTDDNPKSPLYFSDYLMPYQNVANMLTYRTNDLLGNNVCDDKNTVRREVTEETNVSSYSYTFINLKSDKKQTVPKKESSTSSSPSPNTSQNTTQSSEGTGNCCCF
eukprot:TRINITY_DN92_c0_g1_i2.p1 TRINITY_DN92_c0_g1~~TRINITY_DN92_c0_g1_i2.p1  ORF type:complete len:457 (+),score=96.90 TRINITY_DN92_c0_g1_i2:38-1408(+)